jgi:hypothetical protein
MHGGTSAGGPRGNQHALKHGRYSLVQVLLKRQARQEQHRLQALALAAKYGFTSLDEACDALFARLKVRSDAHARDDTK